MSAASSWTCTAHRPRVLRRLRGMVALGHERTIDQDPAFAVRIIVDIAIRALSPAVNDPTTATQMINHLGAVLAGVGGRVLSGHGALVDADGHLRLAVPTRSWDDYLDLGVSEIRQYGRGSPADLSTPEGDVDGPRPLVLPVTPARGTTTARGPGRDGQAHLRRRRRADVRPEARTGRVSAGPPRRRSGIHVPRSTHRGVRHRAWVGVPATVPPSLTVG